MVAMSVIAELSRRIAEEFNPDKIILFGSHAYGAPREYSDVDLLVIMPHEGHAAVQAAEIRKRIRAGFPMDLIVRSPRVIRQRLAMDDFFITEILEQGETLYEVQHARVG